MELYITKGRDKKQKEIKISGDGMVFVRVSESEAINIISSLSEQISRKNSNAGREESYTNDGIYFSIAVVDFKNDLIKKLEDELQDIKIKTSSQVLEKIKSTYIIKDTDGGGFK
jgi:hypothetical protein